MVNERRTEAPSADSRETGPRPSPAPADHGSVNHIVTPADLAGILRDRANRRLDNGELTTTGADYHFKLADLCEQRNIWPVRQGVKRNWFGTMGMFRRALANIGLGDNIGPVIVIKDGVATETDMSFSEFMAAGERLPSEEEATEQAMRGPLGGGL